MRCWDQVAILGVGLIGGSLGLALLERKMAREVIGVGRRASTLKTAERIGAVTRTSLDCQSAVAGADLIVVCTPVAHVSEHVKAAAAACRKDCLITDVGSTKSQIVNEVEQAAAESSWPRGVRFLGSHPLAGAEKSGPEYASGDLFVGRVVIVTPSEKSTAADRESLKQFWTSVGAKVVEMSAAQHDDIIATTSHMPHLVASAVAAATPAEYVTLTARGWQDTTRIAAADPDLWVQIFMANAAPVLAALDRFEEMSARLRSAIERSDHAELKELLTQAKSIRDAVGS